MLFIICMTVSPAGSPGDQDAHFVQNSWWEEVPDQHSLQSESIRQVEMITVLIRQLGSCSKVKLSALCSLHWEAVGELWSKPKLSDSQLGACVTFLWLQQNVSSCPVCCSDLQKVLGPCFHNSNDHFGFFHQMCSVQMINKYPKAKLVLNFYFVESPWWAQLPDFHELHCGLSQQSPSA